ncbi:carbohydrate ABC transporter permease [Cohnella sp. NL03-T5]|nr:carbohydrate ABC transporter permease [Cohnella silvisoli]
MVVYPMVWTLFGSLKDNQQFFMGKPWNLPKLPLLWSNFSYTWDKYHFGAYFLNSVIVTLGSMALALILAASSAYVLARYSFKGSGVVYYFYIASLMIPGILALIPTFFLLFKLHLNNTFIGLITVYAIGAVPFGIFMLIGFFKALPRELEEAAVIDGASHFGTFFKIMLPLAKPGLLTFSIINLLGMWNEYAFALVLVNDPAKYTLPVGIAVMQAEMQYRTEWGALFAGLLMSIVPVLILYILFQNRITEGVTAGAVKA